MARPFHIASRALAGGLMTVIRGSCLCGSVRFEVTEHRDGIGVCHCSVCRKITSSAFTAILVAPGHGFKWICGEDQIGTYSRPPGLSVAWCQRCGSRLPDTNPARTIYAIPAGLLDDDPGVPVIRHIYVDSKASWETIGGDAPKWPEDSPD
jgi:hypothetical protein